MNSEIASPDTALVIAPATDDMHDRAYRFGKPLTYLSDRQHVRVVILRSRLQEALAARDANTSAQLAIVF